MTAVLPPVTAPELDLFLATALLAAFAIVLAVRVLRRRSARSRERRGSAAVAIAAVAALACTAYSADTSWRFAADYLDMAGTAERAGMFAAAELALFATALMARQNLTTQGAPGVPGTLVWIISGVQVIPAYAESGPVGGTVRAFVGPIMAAVLWHLAMGIELRLRTPGAASRSLIATLGREARERLLSRLGIAARDRDAAQITRDRATDRAVALAARLAEQTPEQQHDRRGRRLTRRLSKALGKAEVGTDPDQRARLLRQLAARRHAVALATIALPSPWSPPTAGTLDTAVPAPTVPVAGDRGPNRLRGPVPAPMGSRINPPTGSVPAPGPHTPSEAGDLGPNPPRGPVPAPAPHHPGTGTEREDREPGTAMTPNRGPVPTSMNDQVNPPTVPDPPVPAPGPHTEAGDRGPNPPQGPVPAPAPHHPGTGTEPEHREPGTATTPARGPVPAPAEDHPGTEPTPHRGPGRDRGPGTVRRKKAHTKKSRGKRSSRSRTPRQQDPALSVDQLVQQVRPHVPDLLARDGNTAVTRVQLREILRREGLVGGRNSQLSLVLHELRSDNHATTTKDTT
ncbi:hypothetical protein AA958_19215 [Streptomyces sp. CNQ-509]|uniref:hypothetical protein n=1 Tax=Streptomyces sp. CNQ-509 TaxID=444103 RepID=UPI00062DDA4C|nr:hypothetical protein [Streptomyces sp. CNQ-509]AKH83961.1 hypothetical protein AA958_19215 [Streptomyces sp. CNQ-509]